MFCCSFLDMQMLQWSGKSSLLLVIRDFVSNFEEEKVCRYVKCR